MERVTIRGVDISGVYSILYPKCTPELNIIQDSYNLIIRLVLILVN